MIAFHPGPLAVILTLTLCSGQWLAEARAQGLSDPMQPPAFAASASNPSAGGLVLQSTLTSGGRRIAMIGGKLMKVGDRIGEARIVNIEPASVTLREGATTRVLELYQGVEITRPKALKPDEVRKAPGSARSLKKGTE